MACLLSTSVCAQGVREVRTPSFWFLVLGAEQGWDSNPLLVTGGVSDVISTAGASLSLFKRRQVSTYAINATAAINRFQKNTAFTNFAYGVSVSADRRLTAAVTVAAQVGFDTRLSSAVVGAVDLPFLGLVQQKQLTSTVSLADRLTARTTATVRVGYSQAQFDSPGAIPGYLASGNGQLTHVISVTNTIGLDVNAQQGNAQGAMTSLQSLGVNWTKAFGKVALIATAGVVRAATPGRATYGPSGSAALADSIGPGYLTGGYSYTASPAFGLGGILTTSAVFASYDFEALRGNFLSVSGVTGRSKQSGSSLPALRGESVSVRLRRVLNSGLTLSFGSSYRARKDTFLTKGFGASFGLGFTFGS
ncbi:MAG: hypothetical protein H7099_10205 [Gemmatimonadaceae bacterium]|nr:hypothetical protein [Gemmatimonadaceae bacterium]